MIPLTIDQTTRLDILLATGSTPLLAFPVAIGETNISEGFWRFFSDSWPEGGITRWNQASMWKKKWETFLPLGFLTFGEDVFGNQLTILTGKESVQLWNHENGSLHDLLLAPGELLRTVLENGLEWIDFYSDGSLQVARELAPVPIDSHLHWTTPLILGGQVSRGNTSLIQREPHLVGHAKIWAQISGLPPGTTIVAG